MIFQLTHTTRYAYETSVIHCLNEARLTPRSFNSQQVRQTEVRVHPQPAFINQRKDFYGNDVTLFEVIERHDQLEATAESIVEVGKRTNGPTPSISWEQAKELISTGSDPDCIAASEFVYNSPYVPVVPQLHEYALKTFVPERPLIDGMLELTHRIHEDFKYKPKSTTIDLPLAEVLRKRQGVCQDFAHIMIGALRSLRLPARYVSGYVRPGPKVQGAQASHAWIGVFIPGTGWLDFDPTNDLMVSDNHVTVGWGRDYGDVAPIKGITLGGGRQTVVVEVFVQPLEEENGRGPSRPISNI